MIKIVLFFTFFFALGNASESGNEYHREYYKSGEVKSEGWIRNNYKTGYWRFYHSNGKLSEKGHFTKGKRSGYWYFYSATGGLREEGHFENNEKADWWLFYDALGNVNHKCQLSEGIKNGYCLMYKNDDIVKAEKYRNGKKIKSWSSFSSFRRENKLSDLR